MSKFEFGIVKFFNENKQFGFIRVTNRGTPTGEELFFHYNSGYVLVEGKTEPEFKLQTSMVGGRVQRLPFPVKGEPLAFIRGCNAQGDKVGQWAYGKQYDAIVDRIASRPTYRVVRYTGAYQANKVRVLWKGQNIDELSALFPKRINYGRVYDQLDAGSADSGDLHWRYQLQERVSDTDWKSCDDPRKMFCCLPPALARRYQPTMSQERCLHGNRY